MAFGTKRNASLLSGQTTSTTGTAVQLINSTTPGVGGVVTATIVQVGAATTAATFSVEVSVDVGSTYRALTAITAPTAAGTYDWTIGIPDATTHVRIDYTAQSGGTSSTMDAQIGWVDAS